MAGKEGEVKRRPLSTEKSIKNRIAQGYGTGAGKEYRPWLKNTDVRSYGTTNTILGRKTGRPHIFFSNLEADYFYLLEWNDDVKDIREQFPLLPQSTVERICTQIGVKPPVLPGGDTNMVMTTDFLVKMRDGTQHARSIKGSADLENPRTVEKLEVERIFWELKGIPHKIVSENDIPIAKVNDIKWIFLDQKTHPSQKDRKEIEMVRKIIEPEVLKCIYPLLEITEEADKELG